MATIARLQTSSCSNPVLDLWTSVGGVLTDVFSLEYQVFDITTGTAVQVFPVTPGTRATADVVNDCPVGHRLGVGHYVGFWSVPGSANVGRHQVRWFFKLTDTAPEETYVEDFDVIAEVAATSDTKFNYLLVSDLRDEGVTVTPVFTNAWLLKRISLASRFVERATGQFFSPRAMVLTVDGTGGPCVQLDHPIISIASVEYETRPFDPSSSPVDPGLLRIYNRHLTQGLLSPDDRANPKIELFHPAYDMRPASYSYTRLTFPEGRKNIRITGIFGYTDNDGSATGSTPELIKHVTKLIVMRELNQVNSSARDDAINRHRLVSERTRDQAYQLSPRGGQGNGQQVGGLFTGDPEIDNILVSYMRPPALGAA